MPAPLVGVLAGLVGRSVGGAALRLGSVAATVGKSVKAATMAAGNAGLAAVTRGAIGTPAAPAAGSAAPGVAAAVPKWSIPGMLKAIPRAAGGMLPKNQFTQKITQSIQQFFNIRPNLKTAPTSAAAMPGLSPGELIKMMGKPQSEIDKAQQAAQDQQLRNAQSEAAAANNEELARSGLKLVAVMNLTAGAFVTANLVARRFAHASLENVEHLRQYNGRIAAAFSRLEYQGLLLNVQRGQGTAASTEQLARAVERMNAATAPLETEFTNLRNKAAAFGATIIETNANMLSFKLSILKWLSGGWWTGKGGWFGAGDDVPVNQQFGQVPANKFILDMAEGRWAGHFPPRMAPPEPLRKPK